MRNYWNSRGKKSVQLIEAGPHPGPVTERIAIDPAIMMGKPVIRRTRITVELILRKLAEGAGESDLLEDYPQLAADDIRAAVAYGAASVPHEEIILLTNDPARANS